MLNHVSKKSSFPNLTVTLKFTYIKKGKRHEPLNVNCSCMCFKNTYSDAQWTSGRVNGTESKRPKVLSLNLTSTGLCL